MNRFISNPSRSRAGVTLVELLVAMGAMVAIMGMAYGIYDATRDSSIKLSRRHQAVDYAALVMSELVLLLEGAMPPDALDGVEPAAAAPIFESERIAVAGWRNQDPAEGLFLTTIEPASGGEPGVHYTRHDAPIQTGAEAIGEDRGPQPLGGKNEHFTPKITFSYAAGAAEPGERVDYQPEIAEGAWPRLIQIHIFIPMEGKEVVLQTAVIPGRPIGAGAIAARDERAPEATAEATPAATPRPTPEVTPTASPEPTATPSPTPSPTATPIPPPPPPLPILPPIRTPRPTATPAATPSPTPPGIKVGGRSGR